MIGRILYARERKDRWRRFHAFKEAYLRGQQAPPSSSEERAALSRVFTRLGYGKVPAALFSFWQALVALGARRKAALRADDFSRITALARDLDPVSLSSLCWLDLYHLCLGVGLFQTGKVLRGQGLARMIHDASPEQASLEQVTLGCYGKAENGDFDGARSFVYRLGQLGCADERLAQARWFVELLAGERDRDKFGFETFLSATDMAFGQLIRGKRIALVGPVPSGVVQGGEIDHHDFVAKFNYRGGDKGCDPTTQGARLDISYYNNEQARTLAAADYNAVLPTLRWGVFVNRQGRSCFPADYAGLRQLASLQWMLPDTHFNAGPNAILDMLRFCPEHIKVFNTDLMLSAGRFAGYQTGAASPIDYTRSFIKTHDPILQYQITRHLWCAGYLSGDQRFADVMEMGLRDYLDQLQKTQGATEQALF